MATMLQHLRETAHLGQRELANRAGISQETLSQLETGKSARPRLDTLTKLRNALELDDMRPEDLLDPTPLADDKTLAPAATQLITLLKVLPGYRRGGSDRQAAQFWRKLSTHLGYQDLYPATHLTAHLEQAIAGRGTAPEADLAEYTLMFFDPEDAGTIEVLAEHAGIGPSDQVARRWCRDVTDAAWVIHRAAMTSYPSQVGELYAEAGSTTDPKRLPELCDSVYDIVRSRAIPRASVDLQLAALRKDPSSEVHSMVAERGGPAVQKLALTVVTSWPGLSRNEHLDPAIADQLFTDLLPHLDGPRDHEAGFALMNLAERPDLPRPLLERIRTTLETDHEGGWATSAWIAVRGTLANLDGVDDDEPDTDQPALRLVHNADQPTSWWRRFLNRT